MARMTLVHNCPKCGKEMREQKHFPGLWTCIDYGPPLNDKPPYRYKCDGMELTKEGAKAFDACLLEEHMKRIRRNN